MEGGPDFVELLAEFGGGKMKIVKIKDITIALDNIVAIETRSQVGVSVVYIAGADLIFVHDPETAGQIEDHWLRHNKRFVWL